MDVAPATTFDKVWMFGFINNPLDVGSDWRTAVGTLQVDNLRKGNGCAHLAPEHFLIAYDHRGNQRIIVYSYINNLLMKFNDVLPFSYLIID